MVIVVRHTVIWLLLLSLHAAVNVESFSSVASQFRSGYKSARTLSSLDAKPQRLQENVDGVVYVNDKCINCAACAAFAPASFSRSNSDNAHFVHHQPETLDEIEHARAALAACPVAAIRVETLAERRHRASTPEQKQLIEDDWTEQEESLVRKMAIDPARNGLPKPFPKPLLGLPNAYWVGHHNERSFGGVPYLFQASVAGKSKWILVDTPKYSKSSLDAIVSVTGPEGPDYLFLTHVDDTADHGKWASHFPSLQRIFHDGDLGEHNWLGDETLADVEILLSKQPRSDETVLTAYQIDGTILSEKWQDTLEDDVVILHTPGHSPGSICLYWRSNKLSKDQHDGVVFTGDTYGYTTRNGGQMTAFPRYGNNLRTLANSLTGLLSLDWHTIAPGHGEVRDYSNHNGSADDVKELQRAEMQTAVEEMMSSGRW
jgi:glyoxylase-like metal-dependent hydrolase (beta-lactamase superfamily II)/ferredoxin